MTILENIAQIAQVAIHWTAIATVLLNEIALLSSLWIVSGAPAATCSTVTPTFTAIAYALSEPLWTVLLNHVPLPSWLPFPSAHALQIFSAVHGMTAVLTTNLLRIWTVDDEKGASSSSLRVYAAHLLLIQTTALQNAGLLIWAKQLGQYSFDLSTNQATLVCYIVVSGCSNFFWCGVTRRAWFFRSGQYLRSQLYHLAVLLLLRLCARKALGLEVLSALEVL